MFYNILFTFCFALGITQFSKAQTNTFVYELDYKHQTNGDKVEKITFYLDVVQGESVFRSAQLRNSDSLLIKRGFPGGVDMQYNNKQLYVYKNLKENKILKYVFVPFVNSSVFAIPINDKLDWIISEDEKKIDIYNCQKATAEYGGRKWEAWFTNEIPVQEGPYIFHGLAGLIVQIHDVDLDYSFQLSQIKKFEWKDLSVAKAQRLITWKDFQKLQKDFYSNPLSNINRSDVTHYDESGNVVKIDFKQMINGIQKRINEKNNPLELEYKVDFKK